MDFQGESYQFLLSPMKIKYFPNNRFIEYDLYSKIQFEVLRQKHNLKYPKIIYKKGDIYYMYYYIFDSYVKPYKEGKEIYIKEKVELKILSKEKFIFKFKR